MITQKQINPSFPLLSEHEQAELYNVLFFMKMEELKKACQQLGLPAKGKKIPLIKRIATYIKTGKIIQEPKIPAVSHAQSYPPQPLAPSALMLYKAYKNDAKTRAFFKQLVGPQFHFTAFGIDWLNERWLAGNPPTYQEFADFWIAETYRRKQEGAVAKDEWALIKFVQDLKQKNPHAVKNEIMAQWKLTQKQQARKADKLLQKAVYNLLAD